MEKIDEIREFAKWAAQQKCYTLSAMTDLIEAELRNRMPILIRYVAARAEPKGETRDKT